MRIDALFRMRTLLMSEPFQSFVPSLSPTISFKKKHSLKRNCFEKSSLLYTQQGNCIFTAAFYCRRIKRIMSSPARNLPYRDILFGIIRRSRAYVKLFSISSTYDAKVSLRYNSQYVPRSTLRNKKGLKGYRAYMYPFYRNL